MNRFAASWLFILSVAVLAPPLDGRTHPQDASGLSPPPEPMSCLSPFSLVKRAGAKDCWVQFDQGGEQSSARRSKICVSQQAWYQWLSAPVASPLCLTKGSRRKVKATQALVDGEKKKILITYSLRAFSPPRSIQALQGQSPVERARRGIERTRESISNFLKRHDPVGVLRSLILNEAPNHEPLPMLRRLGFVHLVSATGIHLYALSDAIDRGCFWIFRLARGRPALGLWISRGLSFVACSTLWLLSGARAGMLRPWVLLSLRGLAGYLGFRWTLLSPLFLVIATELLVQLPRLHDSSTSTLLSSGKWVYSLAVGGGLLFVAVLREKKKKPTHLETHMSLAVGSWVGVALYEIYHEGMVALFTPLFSLITLPLICSLVYPITLFTLLVHFTFPGAPPTALVEAIFGKTSQLFHEALSLLSRLALLPGNLLIVPQWALFLGGMGAIAFIAARKLKCLQRVPTYALLIGVSLGVLAIRIFPYSPSSFRSKDEPYSVVQQLDVGQGDSALIRSSEQVGLIDTGSKRTTSDITWLKLFASQNITRLSWVALTHLDEDHAGGLLRLATLIPIDCVAWLPQNIQTERGRNWFRRATELGLSVKSWSSSCIPYPHSQVNHAPPQKGCRGTKSFGNSLMGAILVPFVTHSGKPGVYLNAGDATKKDERRILKWAQGESHFRKSLQVAGASRILKVSHHGSAGSTHEELLKAFKPTEAWISAGTGNRYGHPKPAVLNLLEKYKIRARRTDQEGSISILKNSKIN